MSRNNGLMWSSYIGTRSAILVLLNGEAAQEALQRGQWLRQRRRCRISRGHPLNDDTDPAIVSGLGQGSGQVDKNIRGFGMVASRHPDSHRPHEILLALL